MSRHRGGTDREYLIGRVAAIDPGAADRIRNREVSALRIAVRLGILPRRFMVIASSAEKVAATLRRQLGNDTAREIARILLREEPDR